MLSKFNNKKHRRLTALLLCVALMLGSVTSVSADISAADSETEIWRRVGGRSGFLWGTGDSGRSSGRDIRCRGDRSTCSRYSADRGPYRSGNRSPYRDGS